MLQCARCGQDYESEHFILEMVHKICYRCRIDNMDWHYGVDITINDMLRESLCEHSMRDKAYVMTK